MGGIAALFLFKTRGNDNGKVKRRSRSFFEEIKRDFK